MSGIDLRRLQERLREALPQLKIELGELVDSETRVAHAGIAIENPTVRAKNRVYRLTIVLVDDAVDVFVHTRGVSEDLTTKGTDCYSKECTNIDEVLTMVLMVVRTCWTGGGS